jgi:hypothetical protein
MIEIIATSPLTAEKSAKPEEENKENATDTVEVVGGQMEKIRVKIEQLLRDGAPLSILTPRQAWRRITDQLKSTGVNVRELSSSVHVQAVPREIQAAVRASLTPRGRKHARPKTHMISRIPDGSALPLRDIEG